MANEVDGAPRSLAIISLFTGVAGLDLGLESAGHHVVEMCESWDPARAVLAKHFDGMPIASDVQTYRPRKPYQLLTAGFPCVDLSHAGSQRGIFGPTSGLVSHVFRIIEETQPEWVLIENVPNLLRLGKGAGIAYVVDSLAGAGYKWAYRVVDSRASGVPQRRNRVIILASRTQDPAPYLLADEADKPAVEDGDASGFYWTEGRRGVGLVNGAVPTLKGGSTLGLPSAPAIWRPWAPVGRRIVLPTVEDGEELQGFARGWTSVAATNEGPDPRWKLVGNAVTVGIAKWLGDSLASPDRRWNPTENHPLNRSRPWPDAAWGDSHSEWASQASKWPVQSAPRSLRSVLVEESLQPLSHRATAGFLSRVADSGIPLTDNFVTDLERHLAATRRPIDSPKPSWASSPETRRRMQKVKSRGTKPEVQLRRALTDAGMRYRLQVRTESDLPWRSDIVFIGARIIIDVRGCYWHACEIHSTMPKSNVERWSSKLAENRERDSRMVEQLSGRGWHVFTVWEHERAEDAADRIAELVSARTEAGPRSSRR